VAEPNWRKYLPSCCLSHLDCKAESHCQGEAGILPTFLPSFLPLPLRSLLQVLYILCLIRPTFLSLPHSQLMMLHLFTKMSHPSPKLYQPTCTCSTCTFLCPGWTVKGQSLLPEFTSGLSTLAVVLSLWQHFSVLMQYFQSVYNTAISPIFTKKKKNQSFPLTHCLLLLRAPLYTRIPCCFSLCPPILLHPLQSGVFPFPPLSDCHTARSNKRFSIYTVERSWKVFRLDYLKPTLISCRLTDIPSQSLPGSTWSLWHETPRTWSWAYSLF
jgi:hypothetical protein